MLTHALRHVTQEANGFTHIRPLVEHNAFCLATHGGISDFTARPYPRIQRRDDVRLEHAKGRQTDLGQVFLQLTNIMLPNSQR